MQLEPGGGGGVEDDTGSSDVDGDDDGDDDGNINAEQKEQLEPYLIFVMNATNIFV